MPVVSQGPGLAALGCDAMDHEDVQEAGQVLERWQRLVPNMLGSDCLCDLEMEISLNQLQMWVWSSGDGGLGELGTWNCLEGNGGGVREWMRWRSGLEFLLG